MSTPGTPESGASKVADLISRAKEIGGRGRSLQRQGAVSTEEIEAVRDEYFEWYAEALLYIPEPLIDKFRDYFEGGEWTPRIKAFLANPRKANEMFDPTSPMFKNRFEYNPDRQLIENLEGQRQILIEVSKSNQLIRDQRRGGGHRVFLIHGHSEHRIHEVSHVISLLTGHQPIVLRNTPNEGRTIIEKIEDQGEQCGYAVALLTPDDVGRAKNDDETKPRARQNVVFEAGYFVGRIGRNRVALLVESGVERPSDLSGIVYISMGSEWKIELARELNAAGIAADLNKLNGN